MKLAREMGREEKALMFHEVRESRGARESLCVTWL